MSVRSTGLHGWCVAFVILFGAGGLNASCTSSTSSASGAGGALAGICPLYAGSLSVSCPANETLVCGFAGLATGCCPTVSPFYCSSTQSCYPTADAAAAVCGSSCERCLSVDSTTVASSTTSTSGSSSGDGGTSCNLGAIYSPPEPAGSTCTNGPACTQAPFSCISAQGQEESLVCCCDAAGTACIGCMADETCGGAIKGSPVSCCAQ
jgi:hypothetical protein